MEESGIRANFSTSIPHANEPNPDNSLLDKFASSTPTPFKYAPTNKNFCKNVFGHKFSIIIACLAMLTKLNFL